MSTLSTKKANNTQMTTTKKCPYCEFSDCDCLKRVEEYRPVSRPRTRAGPCPICREWMKDLKEHVAGHYEARGVYDDL